jgi:VIT1/CCC1 family predicted Fe2+/Mn2+ transporter
MPLEAPSASSTGRTDAKRVERVLDPLARISEILFGLIMALTFTGALAVTSGRDEVRTLLVGAIGCNIAWGLVDAVMYLIGALTERGRDLVTVRAVREAGTPAQARHRIVAAVSPMMTSILTEQDIERVRLGLLQLRDLPPAPALTAADWRGALAVFLLVFLSTFPVVIPFLVFRDVPVALRASNLVAIAMLFACGYLLARHGGYHPWRTGFSMVVIGVVLVGIAIALGG